MVPSKVEITLRKADQVAWGKLEDPNYKPEPEPVEDTETTESYQPDWDIADDDISDSDEEWAYDTAKNKTQEEKNRAEQKRKVEEEEKQNLKRKEVEEEMKRATEERKRADEERQRRQEEEGYEDMPDLE